MNAFFPAFFANAAKSGCFSLLTSIKWYNKATERLTPLDGFAVSAEKADAGGARFFPRSTASAKSAIRFEKKLFSFFEKRGTGRGAKAETYGGRQTLPGGRRGVPPLPPHRAVFHRVFNTPGTFFHTLSQRHIQDHHQGKAHGKGNGAKVGVLTLAHLRDQLLHHHVQHGACGKAEKIGQGGQDQA